MVFAKLFFNNKCFKRFSLSLDEGTNKRVIKRCIYHSHRFRGYTLLECDFDPKEEKHPTLLNQHFHKISLGNGYHYEYYA